MCQCRREATANDSNSLKVATSPRGLTFHCTDKAGNIFSAPLEIFRDVLLLRRLRRGTAGLGELK
jgi:hypothetical protein